MASETEEVKQDSTVKPTESPSSERDTAGEMAEIRKQMTMVLDRLKATEEENAALKGLLLYLNELDSEKKPTFFKLMESFTGKPDQPQLLEAAKYLYANRIVVKPDAHYGSDDALSYCAKYPCLTGMLEWFLKEGSVDPTFSDALHYAAMKNHLKAARLLLADPRVNKDKQWSDGRTALVVAVQFNHSAMVSLLLEHGCDKSIKTESYDTALDIAREEGFAEIVQLLK